ncbi:hypothetical protein CKQ90_33805 [Klebsiella pneumoniae]|nr:hypothetical protein CKQ90_33805 [Klebsiella pneumoniae]
MDAMTIMRRGRLLPRYQQLLQRLLNNCVVDGDYRCTDGRYVRAAPLNINSGRHDHHAPWTSAAPLPAATPAPAE